MQLSRMSIPCDLHPKNVMRCTKVIHCEFQQLLLSELGKLSDMSTGEQHIVYVEEEEDGTPIKCVLTIEAMVLIRSKKADRSYEIVKLPIVGRDLRPEAYGLTSRKIT
jgi:hypothetical protein